MVAFSQEEENSSIKIPSGISISNSSFQNISRKGNVCFHNGMFDSAFYFYQVGLAIAKALKSDLRVSQSMGNLANVYLQKSDYNKALELQLSSLKIVEQLQMADEIQGNALNIGNIYYYQKDYYNALGYYNRSRQISLSLKDSFALLPAYDNIGLIYVELNKQDSALLYFDTAIALLEKLDYKKDSLVGFEDNQQNLFVNVAHLKNKQHQYKEALEKMLLLWETVKTNNNTQAKLDVLTAMIMSYKGMGQYKEAEEKVKLAKLLSQKDNLPDAILNIYGINADLQAALGNYRLAYQDHVLYKELSDSLYNKEKTSILNDIQVKYDTEKKDAQILQLNKDKRTQQLLNFLGLGLVMVAFSSIFLIYRSFKQKQKIQAQQQLIDKNNISQKITELEQTALRAQMNPHFIFNCLNSIQHILAEKGAVEAGKYITTFSTIIRQTLDYSGRQLISLKEEISYLNNYLSLQQMRFNHGFNYFIHIDEVIDQYNALIPSMLLQPFLENSIQHGIANKKDGKGTVTVRIEQKDMLICTLEDNGIGREKGIQQKLQMAGEQYESKGIPITMNRINAYNQLFQCNIAVRAEDIKSKDDTIEGTRTLISIPLDIG